MCTFIIKIITIGRLGVTSFLGNFLPAIVFSAELSADRGLVLCGATARGRRRAAQKLIFLWFIGV